MEGSNFFKEDLKVTEDSMIVSKLRSVADGIEKGEIQLDMCTSQELERLLSQAEKGAMPNFIMPADQLQESFDVFANAIQQATTREDEKEI